jgi:putative component of membrane protein insertase Oxa1/YidC/SpoIIIJ protein YidD
MADPAIQELKRNAMILGAWLAAIRIAPYVCHALQSKN